MSQQSLVALLHGPDRPGLVAQVAGWIFERGGNILHADQHRDAEENIFIQRVEWVPSPDRATRDMPEFELFARDALRMKVRMASSQSRERIVVLVSKIPHCFQDIVLRWKGAELGRGDLVCVVSNHPDMGPFSETFDLPYFHIPSDAGRRAVWEAQLLKIVREFRADLVIMARFMQILSAQVVDAAGCPIINIHHSFLPAFAGARPYHQAYARGVKLIGATAHYATAALDQGPIIAQDVARISHRHSVEDLVRRGRDLEKTVFAQAVRAHLDHRVLAYGNKTVVFD